ncbi:Ig-like domain-containing protein [Psychrobacillus psychrodurans]|uniref:Ig-like domain-containing protein n=1 Tax=Psychrobacillus psychrodurans TaxID=126157 RepID=UPI0008E510B6|nr:Ig-like domain-containing protein [Psychrobacillus psychrodurans]MCZ8539045.1 Ig-like domain-containing protein [Psychrobacillus psychrodurans]SFM27501.1 Beta-N-acetylglucosaminidase [Psychrobacillus psychrodurans]
MVQRNHSNKNIIISFLTLLMMLILPAWVAAAPTDEATNVSTNKTWTITFNKAVDPTSVNLNSVYVLDQFGVKNNGTITISPDRKSVTIAPPVEGYNFSNAYTLHITNSIKDESGKPLSSNKQKKFTIETHGTYDIVNIASDGTTSFVNSYDSYENALTNLKSSQGIQYKDSLVKIPSGMVVTRAHASNVLTNIYSDKQLSKPVTYVISNTELPYISSTDTYVEVNVAGKNMFISQENSKLIPQNALTGRSYYSVSNSELVHSIYSTSSKTYSSYQIGAAPNFMTAGQKYYSVDGTHFTNTSGQEIGTSYPYFEYLSARSKTTYTAEEIDAYISAMLLKLESDYPNNVLYQQASQKSKLIGLGSYLKQIEETQHINALFILALAQHESAYGLSNRAQQYNNLFGLYVSDNNPLAKYFPTVESNIDELINAFINKNYLPPNAGYANGAVFGNKAIGINMKYASDPYWGAKAAGHMYRIDQMMGGKDSITKYKLGITNTSGLNVRTGPGTEYTAAYRYTKAGMPITILDDNLPEAEWIKILSDSVDYEELYIHRDYVQEIPVK